MKLTDHNMIKVNHFNKAAPEYIHEKKHETAKKMSFGEHASKTFSKLGKAVSKLGSTHKKYGDKPF